MTSKISTISVIGDGGWGTTLAVHLVKKGFAVHLWGPFPKYIRQMARNKYNSKFLPGVRLTNIQLEEDLTSALEAGELIVFAIPSKYALETLKGMKKTGVDFSAKIVVSVTKGFDTGSLKTISQLMAEQLGEKTPLAVLSGPTIAVEVAKGIPSTAVLTTPNQTLAAELQDVFNTKQFRVYTNTDVIGVELGGSLKNVIAIACGICDGLGYGTNTKAAILTRGLAEIARLGKAMGANPETFTGLSGLGDLITTCFSPNSRNRTVGEKIGKGKNINKILGSMEQVAEGVEAAQAVLKLAHKYHIPMPITQEVHNILFKDKKPAQAVADLMLRDPKPEST